MVLPVVFLVNDAILTSKRQSFDLKYKQGTAAFTPGATLTGSVSGATAVIISCGGVTSGILRLHTISGTFQNNEPITDDGPVPGAAVVDGVISPTLNSYGELVFIDMNQSVKCRFVAPKKRMIDGMMVASLPRVLLTPTVPVSENDTITSTDAGFDETFGIKSVKIVYEAATKEVSHKVCELGAVI